MNKGSARTFNLLNFIFSIRIPALNSNRNYIISLIAAIFNTRRFFILSVRKFVLSSNFKIMDVLNAILDRRSIRNYQAKEIPEDIILTLLKAGMYAPSSRNTQSWHFIVIRDRKSLNAIMKVHYYSQMLEKAPLAIMVCGDKNLESNEGNICVNCSAATQNILLAAHELGIGTVWLGVYPRKERMEPIAKLFDLPEHIIPVSLISAGYPDEKVERPERFLPERIHYERW
jgi:nitroreductase